MLRNKCDFDWIKSLSYNICLLTKNSEMVLIGFLTSCVARLQITRLLLQAGVVASTIWNDSQMQGKRNL
jgi:hypothetical protein